MGSSRSIIRKDVTGYEGLYEIDNYGTVYSIRRHNGRAWVGGKTLSYETTKDGYYRVILSRNGESRKFAVHRLVAQAFLANSENYPVVNHKDGNKINNTVDNLEWCTVGYNNQHARDNGLVPSTCKKIKDDVRKAVLEYYIRGSSERGCVATAARFGISKSAVSDIVNSTKEDV